MPRRFLTLDHCRDLAATRGGLCLSDIYVNSRAKLRWRCAVGHEWEAIFESLRYAGSWCPTCAGQPPTTADGLMAIARSRGGSVAIGDGLLNSKLKLRWKCRFGHEWLATPNHIRSGSWCPYCKGGGSSHGESVARIILEAMFGRGFPKLRPSWLRDGGRPLELDGYCEELAIAFEYQGEHHYQARYKQTADCFDKTVRRDATKVRLCKERGIALIVVPFFNCSADDRQSIMEVEKCVRQAGVSVPVWSRSIDSSCNLRSFERVIGAHRLSLLKDAIARRGGLLLTTEISRVTDKVTIRCCAGHEWQTRINDVINGIGCGRCFGRGGTIDDMRAIAESRGGSCLSMGPLKNLKAHLHWKCKLGHEWLAMAYSVKAGKWCDKCARMNNSVLRNGLKASRRAATSCEGELRLG
jgi:hypothetical protein